MEITIPVEALPAVNALARGELTTYPLKYKRNIIALGAVTARTLQYPQESASIVLALTDNTVVTLPLAADAPGCEVTVVNVGADGAAKVSISPASADSIIGSAIDVSGGDATGVIQSGGVANKDWINAKTGANKGDFTKLISDGVNSWIIMQSVGIWASEA